MKRPLAGLEVVVTRPESSDGPLCTLLREHEAVPLLWPSVRVEPPESVEPLREAARRIAGYEWIVFSSPRAVAALAELCPELPTGPRVAVVGRQTAEAVEASGWTVALTAEPARGSVLVESMQGHVSTGSRILFPASSIARPTIPLGLKDLGATVDEVVAYRTLPARLDRAACLGRLEQGRIAAVTFASPSAVDGLLVALERDAFRRLLALAPAVAIGPTTTAALEAQECPPAAVARESSLQGLVRAVEELMRQSAPRSREA